MAKQLAIYVAYDNRSLVISRRLYIRSINLDKDETLDRILARGDFTEGGMADDEPRLSPELVGAV